MMHTTDPLQACSKVEIITQYRKATGLFFEIDSKEYGIVIKKIPHHNMSLTEIFVEGMRDDFSLDLELSPPPTHDVLRIFFKGTSCKPAYIFKGIEVLREKFNEDPREFQRKAEDIGLVLDKKEEKIKALLEQILPGIVVYGCAIFDSGTKVSIKERLIGLDWKPTP